MDDLTITRLCARAAGVSLEWDGPPPEVPMYYEGKTYHLYEPLRNRAQALELVERLKMRVEWIDDMELWCAIPQDPVDTTLDPSILRAICLCAARVQQAREAK